MYRLGCQLRKKPTQQGLPVPIVEAGAEQHQVLTRYYARRILQESAVHLDGTETKRFNQSVHFVPEPCHCSSRLPRRTA